VMRVLYVLPQAELGGAERVTLDLLALHDRAVIEPLACFLRPGPLVEHCRDRLGVSASVVEAPALRQIGAARRAVRAIAELARAEGATLVHSVMAWGHLYGGRAARQARIPAVWFQHATPSWRSALEVAASLVPARRILANSRHTAGFQSRLNPRGVPIATIHPGTRIPEESRSVRRARGRAALGLSEEVLAVGLAARLQRWKGHEVFLRAGALLCRARSPARLFLIGTNAFGLEPEYPDALRHLAAELGIADRVVFTGHRDDVPDCLAAMDIAVHTSTSPEPFGLAVIEAMAAGTPIVAAEGGATAEIVTSGHDGVLVPAGDPESLAVTLLALCDDPDTRIRLAEAGECTARERFDAVTMTRTVEAVYAEILGK